MRKLLLIFGLLLASVCYADNPIYSHDFSGDANSSTLPSGWVVVMGTMDINAGRLRCVTGPCLAKYTGDTFPNDQYALVKVTGGNWANGIGVALRIVDSTTHYNLRCTAISGSSCSTVFLRRNTTNVTSAGSLSVANTATLKVRASGTTLSMWSGTTQLGTNATDSNIASGAPGVYMASSSQSISYFEAGDLSTATAPAPTFSPAAGSFLTQQSVTLSCGAPSPTIYYTTDGSTPTTGSSSYSAPLSTPTSGSWTLKALCTASGYNNSSVTSGTYYISPSDVPIASDNFSAYYDSNLVQNQVQQFPLDTTQTAGNWTAVGGIVGDVYWNDRPRYAVAPLRPAYSAAVTSGYAVGGENGLNFAAYTGRSGFFADQYASAKVPNIDSGGYGGVTVRCSTGVKTCYYLITQIGASVVVELGKVVAGSRTVIKQSTAVNVAAGSTLELRVLGNQLQPLLNGAQVSGMNASYTDSAISSGAPGIAVSSGQVSDFAAGNVGAPDTTSPSGYTPTYPTYSDGGTIYAGTWTMGWPWFQGRLNYTAAGVTPWQSPLAPTSIAGGGYGLGNTMDDNSTISYRGGSFGSNQWQLVSIGIDPHDNRVNNWFLPLQHRTFAPGTTGGCAAAGTLSSCYDSVSYYPGVETEQRFISTAGNYNACTGKLEYSCTPFMHITKVTPVASPGDEVVTVAGSYYTPRKGDQIYVEYVAPYLRVACKGWGAEASWQAGHAYAQYAYIKDSVGNLQMAKTAGTSGGSTPSWTGTWGTPTAYQGSTTTDGGVTWEYMGQPCPTTDKFTTVIHTADTDLAGANGIPALWLGQMSTHITDPAAPAPVFYNWSAGTATPSFACDTFGICDALDQATQWVMW